MTAHIRPATPQDLPAIADIYAHYVTHTVTTFDDTPLPLTTWRQRLDDLSALQLPFLTAHHANEVIGYALATPWRPKPAYCHTVEDSIYLAPEWTGKGLGRPLLEALITAAGEANAKQMIAVIADTGTPTSTALHLACGFTHAGLLTNVGHKHNRWIDTLLLQRSL
ncbi:GNAT family N-acetyltransferase [Sinosporangium siamense]|uniref:N-acetyltransferase n=1 Tax=Sinosporangium siamense TaxID=1367973 RepID=A0A919RDD5_9ACTN|nr:GNAT family N-acetyltransferase [Sinosporangium siamense]GII89771.1 N-acetyltransferase [Sinosporangium siamense]